MRSRDLCPVGSGEGDYEIAELHKAIARAGALLGGRRQSQSGGYQIIIAQWVTILLLALILWRIW